MPGQDSAGDSSLNLRRQPPTEKQLALMKDLGLDVPPECTISRASMIISQAQIIQRYALQVAKQQWSKDLSGLDLRQVMRAVIAHPKMAREMQDIMDANAQAAWTAKSEQDQDAPLDMLPDLREDENYKFIMARLEEFFPQLKEVQRTAVPPSSSGAKIIVARESGMMDKIKDWVDDFLH